jgi:predicted Zn-dependent protease
MKYTPKALNGNVNVSKNSPLKEFFILLGGALGLLMLTYIALGLAVDFIIPKLPDGTEQRLSVLFADKFPQKKPTPVEQQLQQLLDSLVAVLPHKPNTTYRVRVISSKQANALALPGGYIIVLSGLLKEINSENELAFVLSHEIGHFANRDHLRRLGRGLVLSAFSIFLTGLDNGITQLLMQSLLNVELKFSRDQEIKADLYALELLNKRYDHVAGATDFFTRIAARNVNNRLSYYFATHPYPQDRIAALQDQIQAQGYIVGEKTALSQLIEQLPEATEEVSLQDLFSATELRVNFNTP